MAQLRANRYRELRTESREPRVGQAAVVVALRHSLQSTFINWADESLGFHDECLFLIRTTVRETFYRFTIKSFYYS